MRGHCPDCEHAKRLSLWRIVPSPRKADHDHARGVRLYILEQHSDGTGALCPGSGKKI